MTRKRGSRTVASVAKKGTPWAALFLSDLARHGRVERASRSAGVSPRTVQRWARRDPAFVRLVADVRAAAVTDRLITRAEARPTLKNLLAVLRRLRPEQYGRS